MCPSVDASDSPSFTAPITSKMIGQVRENP